MAKFMLLLYDDQAQFRKLSPDEMGKIIAEYGRWAKSLGPKKLAGGEKLKDDPGRIVRMARGKVAIRDGPFTESKEALGGYFLIKAKDYEEALAIVEDCPHVKYGTIVVRQIE